MKQQGAASTGDGPGNIGDKNQSGDAAAGGHAEKRGDGIQNGGPIEGKKQDGKPSPVSFYGWLLQIVDR